MRKIFLLSAFLSFHFIFSQSFIPAYQARVNTTSQTNINTTLTDFASYGVKTTGSLNNDNALAWLKAKYASFGYTTAQIQEDTYSFGSVNSKNLIVTKTGTLYPNTFVIICGHFDTVAGPGVNDNGSGVSVILEAARILKDVPTEYSIKFINFTGEEQGLFGSTHYVNNVVNATTPKMDIRLVFNIDQVGGRAGQVNNTIVCENDQANPTSNNAASFSKTQELKNCVTLYSNLLTASGPTYSSDYVPFQQNNEVVTGFYEYNVSNFPHTSSDTYINMDPVFVYNVTKAAVGALQHFAVASSVLAVSEENNAVSENNISLFPVPAKNFFEIDYHGNKVKNFTVEVIDLSGKVVIKFANKTRIETDGLVNGNYLVKVTDDEKSSIKKLIISK